MFAEFEEVQSGGGSRPIGVNPAHIAYVHPDADKPEECTVLKFPDREKAGLRVRGKIDGVLTALREAARGPDFMSELRRQLAEKGPE
jgi:hypothetical protein